MPCKSQRAARRYRAINKNERGVKLFPLRTKIYRVPCLAHGSKKTQRRCKMNKPNWALDPIIKLTRYEALEILKHREGFCDLTMSTVKNRMDFIVRNISVDFVKIINTNPKRIVVFG